MTFDPKTIVQKITFQGEDLVSPELKKIGGSASTLATGIEADMARINTALDSLNTKFSGGGGVGTSLENTARQVSGSAASIEASLKKVEGQAGNTVGSLKSLGSTAGTAGRQLEGAGNQAEGLGGKLDALNGQVETIGGTFADTSTEIESIVGQLQDAAGAAQDLGGSLSDLQSAFARMKTEVKGVNDGLAKLNGLLHPGQMSAQADATNAAADAQARYAAALKGTPPGGAARRSSSAAGVNPNTPQGRRVTESNPSRAAYEGARSAGRGAQSAGLVVTAGSALSIYESMQFAKASQSALGNTNFTPAEQAAMNRTVLQLFQSNPIGYQSLFKMYNRAGETFQRLPGQSVASYNAELAAIVKASMKSGIGSGSQNPENIAMALATAMHNWGIGPGGASQAMDVLHSVAAYAGGGTTLEKLSTSMGRSSQNAAQMGISMPQWGALFDTLAKQYGPNRADTYLAQMLNNVNVGGTSKEGRKFIQSLGMSQMYSRQGVEQYGIFDVLKTLQERAYQKYTPNQANAGLYQALFTSRNGGNAFRALFDDGKFTKGGGSHQEELYTTARRLGGGTGPSETALGSGGGRDVRNITNTTYNAAMRQDYAQLAISLHKVQGAAIVVGDTLAPAAEKAAHQLDNLAAAIERFTKKHPDTTTNVAEYGVGALIGGWLTGKVLGFGRGVGNVVKAVGGLGPEGVAGDGALGLGAARLFGAGGVGTLLAGVLVGNLIGKELHDILPKAPWQDQKKPFTPTWISDLKAIDSVIGFFQRLGQHVPSHVPSEQWRSAHLPSTGYSPVQEGMPVAASPFARGDQQTMVFDPQRGWIPAHGAGNGPPSGPYSIAMGPNSPMPPMSGGGNGIGNALGALGNDIGGVAGALGHMNDVVTKAIEGWTSQFAAWVSKLPGQIGDGLGRAGDAIGTQLGSWGDTIGGKLGDIGQQFQKTWNDMKTQVGSILGTIGTTIGTQLGAWGSSIGTHMGQLGTQFQKGWTDMVHTVGSVLGQIGTTIGTQLGSWGATIGTRSSQFASLMQHGWQTIEKDVTGILSSLGSTIGSHLANWGAQIQTHVTGFVSKIHAGWNTMLLTIGSFMGQIGSSIGTHLTAIGQTFGTGLSTMAGKLVTWGGQIVSNAARALKNMASTISNGLTGILSNLSTWIGQTLQKLGGWADQAVQHGADFVANLAKGIEDNASKLAAALKGAMKEAMDTAKTFITNHVGDLWSAITNHIPGPVQAILKFIGGGGGAGTALAAGGGGNLAAEFGVTSSQMARGDQWSPLVARADQAGLTSVGGGPLAGDFDFAAPGGSKVFLPAGPGRYIYLGNDHSMGQWGNLEEWQTPNGGVFNLPHLANLPGLRVGQGYAGGSYIGQVGNPYGGTTGGAATPYWTGYHLSVIEDQKAAQYLGGGSGIALGKVPGSLKQWLPMLQQASKKYGVPLPLLLAIMQTESGGDPTAVSGAGAQGLMQIMPGNDRSLGISNPFDPMQNIMGGANLFSQYLKASGGDVHTALARYNAGGYYRSGQAQGYATTVQNRARQYGGAVGGGGRSQTEGIGTGSGPRQRQRYAVFHDATGTVSYVYDSPADTQPKAPPKHPMWQYGVPGVTLEGSTPWAMNYGPFAIGATGKANLQANPQVAHAYSDLMDSVVQLPASLQPYMAKEAANFRQQINTEQTRHAQAVSADEKEYNRRAKAYGDSYQGRLGDIISRSQENVLYKTTGLDISKSKSTQLAVLAAQTDDQNFNARMTELKRQRDKAVANAKKKPGGTDSLTMPWDAPTAAPKKRTAAQIAADYNARISYETGVHSREMAKRETSLGITGHAQQQAFENWLQRNTFSKNLSTKDAYRTYQREMGSLNAAYYGPKGQITKEDSRHDTAMAGIEKQIEAASKPAQMWQDLTKNIKTALDTGMQALQLSLLSGSGDVAKWTSQVVKATVAQVRMQTITDRAQLKVEQGLAVSEQYTQAQAASARVQAQLSLAKAEEANNVSALNLKNQGYLSTLEKTNVASQRASLLQTQQANAVERLSLADTHYLALLEKNAVETEKGSLLKQQESNTVEQSLLGNAKYLSLLEQSGVATARGTLLKQQESNAVERSLLADGQYIGIQAQLSIETAKAAALKAQENLAITAVVAQSKEYVDTLIQTAQATRAQSLVQSGIDLQVGAGTGDLGGIGSAAGNAVTALTGFWLQAVQQGAGVVNQFTGSLLQADAIEQEAADATNKENVVLGLLTGSASKLQSGLQGLFSAATDKIDFFTAALGRTADGTAPFITDIGKAASGAIAFAQNLGSLGEIISGLQSTSDKLLGAAETEFARSGAISPQTLAAFDAAHSALTQANWDKIGADLSAYRSTGDVTGYIASLNAEIGMFQTKLQADAVKYGEHSAQVQQDKDTLKKLQNEADGLSFKLQQLTDTTGTFGDTTKMSADELTKFYKDSANADQAWSDFTTNGLDPAGTALQGLTTLISTTGSNLAGAVNGVASDASTLGSTIATVDGLLGQLGAAIAAAIAAVAGAAGGGASGGAGGPGGSGGSGSHHIVSSYVDPETHVRQYVWDNGWISTSSTYNGPSGSLEAGNARLGGTSGGSDIESGSGIGPGPSLGPMQSFSPAGYGGATGSTWLDATGKPHTGPFPTGVTLTGYVTQNGNVIPQFDTIPGVSITATTTGSGTAGAGTGPSSPPSAYTPWYERGADGSLTLRTDAIPNNYVSYGSTVAGGVPYMVYGALPDASTPTTGGAATSGVTSGSITGVTGPGGTSVYYNPGTGSTSSSILGVAGFPSQSAAGGVSLGGGDVGTWYDPNTGIAGDTNGNLSYPRTAATLYGTVGYTPFATGGAPFTPHATTYGPIQNQGQLWGPAGPAVGWTMIAGQQWPVDAAGNPVSTPANEAAGMSPMDYIRQQQMTRFNTWYPNGTSPDFQAFWIKMNGGDPTLYNPALQEESDILLPNGQHMQAQRDFMGSNPYASGFGPTGTDPITMGDLPTGAPLDFVNFGSQYQTDASGILHKLNQIVANTAQTADNTANLSNMDPKVIAQQLKDMLQQVVKWEAVTGRRIVGTPTGGWDQIAQNIGLEAVAAGV